MSPFVRQRSGTFQLRQIDDVPIRLEMSKRIAASSGTECNGELSAKRNVLWIYIKCNRKVTKSIVCKIQVVLPVILVFPITKLSAEKAKAVKHILTGNVLSFTVILTVSLNVFKRFRCEFAFSCAAAFRVFFALLKVLLRKLSCGFLGFKITGNQAAAAVPDDHKICTGLPVVHAFKQRYCIFVGTCTVKIRSRHVIRIISTRTRILVLNCSVLNESDILTVIPDNPICFVNQIII